MGRVSPLLAHNRCLEPMFSISNEMAYDGAMVQGRAGGEAAGLEVLGPQPLDRRASSGR